MKQIITLCLLIYIPVLFAQEIQGIDPSYQLKALTPAEEIQLKSLPVLEMTEASRNRNLPYMVDNSTEIYMRPVFNQDGYSCGQASGVAYNFTYEMARARNVPANTAANQYTTHFTWNWMNGGNGWYGVSYLHSFQVLKYVGEPDVNTYGGSLSSGGEKRWMSGYPLYYTAMTNRINETFQILCGTSEQLLTLKQWLDNHLDGSDVGGVASYYAQYMSANEQLPPGTPEAGKYVLTYFGGSANHSMCIVGYNDSIRWDYNNDGQYTNDIDINNDGVVNMKDWEIGGLKMVQSYGGVPNWGDQGYAYMMYKTLADDLGQGGIWNHSVHVLDVKENYAPKLTAEVNLTHNRRNQIKVLAGLSNNSYSQYPEIILDFPILDYQGAGYYMQGGSSAADKSIEIGLDLSRILSDVTMDQDVKLFLLLIEKDADGLGTGTIDSLTFHDLTGTPISVICPQSNINIANNDTTILSVIHNFNFNRVTIDDEILPPAPVGMPYSHQMMATGGTLPYVWEFDKSYECNTGYNTYPTVSGQQLYPNSNSSGFVTQAIDFDFPYYDNSFSSITVHVDGYLMFDEQLFPYPYFNDDKVLFEVTRNISAFNTQFQEINTGNSDGIWYEGDSTYATFWWKTTHEFSSATSFNYAVTIYPNGEIIFNYDNMNGQNYLDWWIAGLSDGDTRNLEVHDISHDHSINPNLRIEYLPYNYPPEFIISEDGLISGIPLQSYSGTELTFKVTDNNFISSSKSFLLSSSGIIIQDSISSGDDEILEFGETALMSILVTNLEVTAIGNAALDISIQDEYITVVDSTEYLGTLSPGQSLRKVDAFSFDISSDVPDGHTFTIYTDLHNPDTSYQGIIVHTAFAPVAFIESVVVDDENNRLDPGDTADLIVGIRNTGGAAVNNVYTLLTCTDPFVTINNNLGSIITLEPAETEYITFNVSISDEASNGHLLDFEVDITGDNYATIDTFDLIIGFNSEDFETGDFNFVHWGLAGNRGWQIDSDIFYEGYFSARSGYITHGQESVMMLDMDVIADGNISFYKKVSCEDDESNNNYDYLTFRIDGIEQGRWDGDQDWTLESFSVVSGFHRFEWVYHKDSTNSQLMDGAWIDLITFPAVNDVAPVCGHDPDSFEMIMKPDESKYDTLWLTNNGQGELQTELYIKSESPDNYGSRSILGAYLICSEKILHSGQEYLMNLTVYNSSNDSEWLKDIYIDFPNGMELITATDFVGGSGGDMVHDGTLGNGAYVNWHGEDASNWGVVKGNETAVVEITVFIHDELVEHASMAYQIHGDIYGEEPHLVYGEIPLRNLGTEAEWFRLEESEILIPAGETYPVVVNYNSDMLLDGEYYCEILMMNDFRQEEIIPVNLTVDHLIDIKTINKPGQLSLEVRPNPVSKQAFISYYLPERCRVTLEVFDIHGVLIDKVIEGQSVSAGNHLIYWNLNKGHDKPVPAGIYFCKLTSPTATKAVKIIISE